jgi:outer membrane lipoprotein-sorting protein
MSDMLDQLKEELDEHVLKDLDFRERNKAVVRKHFKSNREPSREKKHFGIGLVLSFCFTVLFLGVAGYFIMDHLGLSKDEGLSQKNDKSNEIQEHKEHTHPQPKENDDVMTKEEVLHKLFNSVDYFETAAGEFEVYDSYYDGSSSKSTVKYKVSNKGVFGGYEKVIDYPNPKNPQSKEKISKTYYNKHHVWHLDLDSMEYVKFGIMPEKKIPIVKADDIFKMDPDDIIESDTMNIFRETPPNMLAGISLYAYSFTAKYLRPENEWSIDKQNEKLLGHNTLVIAGTLDDSLVDTMHPDEKEFRIWVDKDTGIIVKKEIYSNAGELVSYLHPRSLEINTTFHESEFEPELDGFHSFRDERDRELQVIEHADTKRSEVEEVMAIQRETMPLFYEFKDPKLSPFSASIEKYRKDLHAYVVYSYDKPENEVGSGSRLLYTRIYPKDTYLRKTGDFVRPLGEEIDSMKMNGIQWHMFKVEGTDEVHVKGESGDYLIEIVTQKVPSSELKRLLGSFKKVE